MRLSRYWNQQKVAVNFKVNIYFPCRSVIWNIINGIDFSNAASRRKFEPCKHHAFGKNLWIALCFANVTCCDRLHCSPRQCNECFWHQQCIRVKPQMEIIKVKFENLSFLLRAIRAEASRSRFQITFVTSHSRGEMCAWIPHIKATIHHSRVVFLRKNNIKVKRNPNEIRRNQI